MNVEIEEVPTVETLLRENAKPRSGEEDSIDELIEDLYMHAKVDIGPLHPFGKHTFKLGDREAKRKLDTGDFDNWLYDRKTGVIFFDVDYGAHTMMCSLLLRLYEGLDQGYKLREYADDYVKGGYGFFLSSVTGYGGKRVWLQQGGKSKLTGQERMFFRNVNFAEHEK